MADHVVTNFDGAGEAFRIGAAKEQYRTIADRRVPFSEIRRTQYLRRSLMPEGLLDGLTPTQVTDLFAYLLSLKG